MQHRLALKVVALCTATLLCLSGILFADAQTGSEPPPGGTGPIKLCNPLGNCEDTSGIRDIPTFLQRLLEIVQLIAIPIVVFFIIYAGFLFVTARGDTGQLSQARGALLAAVIGTAIILGAWVIATAIKGTVDNIREG